MFRNILMLTVFVVLTVSHLFADNITPSSIIQSASVTIKSGTSEGSGNIISREVRLNTTSADTIVVNFIITAAHVIDDLRSVRSVITQDGQDVKVVEFRDAYIVKEYRQEGRRVGESKMDCRVIVYSDADHGDDLALMLVRQFEFEDLDVTTTFRYEMVDVGLDLWHCGSLLGQMGANSMTKGIMSQQGRVNKGKVYDQTTVSAFPGSSGGGVFLVENDVPMYVGMITRGAGETFNLMVPVRRMQKWAKRMNVEWLLDTDVPTPSLEEILSLPIEINTGGSGGSIRQAGEDEMEFIFLDGEHRSECWWYGRHEK